MPPRPSVNRILFSAAIVLVIAAVFAPYWYWRGGLIEIEALQFVRQYLDDRTVLQKVFDPHANDLGTYQARELSYFVDYLDARVFDWLLDWYGPLFVPASALVASAATVAVFMVWRRRRSDAVGLTLILLLLVYLSNYVHVVTMGMLYRSTKPLLAPVVLGTTFFLLALLRAQAPAAAGGLQRGRLAPTMVFALFCLMSLLDRQGFFYAVLGFGVLLFHAIVAGGRRDVAIAGAAAIAAMVLYNIAVAPAIVQRVNGYAPNFEYQQLPLSRLLEPASWARGAHLLLVGGTVLLGSVSPVGFGAILAAAVFAVARARRRVTAAGPVQPGNAPRQWTGPKAAVLIALVAIALTGMSAMMTIRHTEVYTWADHQLWYYPLPFQALLLALMAALVAARVTSWSPARVTVVNLILAACVVSNVVQWSEHRRTQLGSKWFPIVFYQTDALKKSFVAGQPGLGLRPEYAAFYTFCVQRSDVLRTRAEVPRSAQR